MLTVKATLWHIIRSEGGHEAGEDLLVKMPPLPWWSEYYSRKYSYVLESRGELLWVSVLANQTIFNEDATVDPSELLVTVHAIEKGASGEVRWALRDGKSLRDRVLFLGHPVSFAMDSSQLDMDGGCVYFVSNRDVFRYSLVDGEAKLVRRLHPGWNEGPSPRVWLQPRPPIATIQEIQARISSDEAKPNLFIDQIC
jgi:hypothetical protein